MTNAQTAQWLRAVELEPASTRPSAITQAAIAIAGTATAQDSLDLTLLSFTGEGTDIFARVGDAVRDVDATFGCAVDDLETGIVAAVCLRQVLSDASDSVSAAAAHAILSASWAGLKAPAPELVDIAKAALSRQSEESRARKKTGSTVALAKVLEELPTFESPGTPVMHQEGSQIVAAVTAIATVLKSAVDRNRNTMTRRMQAADEELDLLWWAFSGWSETLEKPWPKVTNGGVAAVVLGLELANNVSFPAEPVSTRELLSRLLGTRVTHTVELGKALEATLRAGVELPKVAGHRLLPVLSSFGEAAVLNGKVAWRGSMARWSIVVDQQVTCLELAEQTVRELLLARQMD